MFAWLDVKVSRSLLSAELEERDLGGSRGKLYRRGDGVATYRRIDPRPLQPLNACQGERRSEHSVAAGGGDRFCYMPPLLSSCTGGLTGSLEHGVKSQL